MLNKLKGLLTGTAFVLAVLSTLTIVAGIIYFAVNFGLFFWNRD